MRFRAWQTGALCERPLSLFLSEGIVDQIIFPVVSLPVTRTEASRGPHTGGSERRGAAREGGPQVRAGKAPLTQICPKAKASGKKLQKVTLKVSPRGIILTDNITNQLIENVSIYRYSQRLPSAPQGGGWSALSESRLYHCLSGRPWLGSQFSSSASVGVETDPAPGAVVKHQGPSAWLTASAWLNGRCHRH